MRTKMIGVAWVTAALLAVAGCGSDTADSEATTAAATSTPAASEPASPRAVTVDDQLGEELADEFFSILQRGDTEELDAFLDPAFQIARADGSTADKAQYLQQPASVQAYQIDNVVATRDGAVLVVRYDVTTEEVIDRQAYASDPAPRLSVFVDEGGSWQMIAHANLNVPSTDTPPAASAAATPLTDPASAEDTATAERVQNEFFAALQSGNAEALAALLSPAFQLVRADGSYANRDEYLANPATMNSFALSDFAVTSQGDLLVARFLGQTSEVINGVEYNREPAPRFAVMKRDGDTWKIVAQVNFNAPTN